MIRFNPCDTYDLLLKQAKSLHMLAKAQEGQIAYLNKRITEFDERKLQASESVIDSQREVIERLTNELENTIRNYLEAKQEINSLQSRMENQPCWVELREGGRSPSDAGDYLVQLSSGHHTIKYYSLLVGFHNDSEVTHWLYLPTLPGEE